MPAKRSEVKEERAADREIVFARVISAWAFVLVIVFWITSTPRPSEGRSVQLWIRGNFVQGSLDGVDPSTQSEGDSEEGTEIILASLRMPRGFDVARRMMRTAWADPKPLEMAATFGDEDCKARLTMRMVFVAAEEQDQNVREYRSVEGVQQMLEKLGNYLSTRPAAKQGETA